MKVSVYIPSYNNAKYLPECLDSILAQTYQDFEIIIADDGSTDGSVDIALQYQSRYPEKIRLVRHPENGHRGFAGTCNLALHNIKGDFIARNDSDDIWMPDKLQKQMEFLETNSQFDFIYSYATFINSSGNEQMGLYGMDITQEENPLGTILMNQCIPENSCVFRRRAFDKSGYYDESIVYSDWDLMVRFLANHKVAFLNQPLVKYRIHNSNMSKSADPKINLERILALLHRIERKSLEIGGAMSLPRNLALLDLQISFHEFCARNMQVAISYLHRAFQKDTQLFDDVTIIHKWLSKWKPNFYSYQHHHFGFWVISNLPLNILPTFRSELLKMQLENPDTKAFFVQRGIENGKRGEPVEEIFADVPEFVHLTSHWKKQVLKHVYPELLFEAHRTHDTGMLRSLWLATIRYDPSWLKNRGVVSIGLQAFFK